MKTIIIILFLCSVFRANAQWNGGTSTTNTTYRSGNVIIGNAPADPDASLQSAYGSGKVLQINGPGAWLSMNGADNGASFNLFHGNSGTSLYSWGGPINFSTSTSGIGTNRMTIAADGKVGIGITAPTRTLDISGNMAIHQVASTAESIPSWGNWALFSWGAATHASGIASGVTGAYIISLNEGTGTLTNSTGTYSLAGNLSNGTGTVTTAYGVRAGVQSGNGTVGTGYGLYIENIRATTDYGLYQVDATDDNYFAGNVGIGTVTPYSHSRLHIKAPAANPWGIMAESSSNDRVIAMSHTGTHGVVAVSYLGGSGYTPLQFWTENQPRMTINTDGNVGIGTSSPNQKLTVKGTIYGEEIKVDLSVPGPDYVFEDDYKLPSLAETEDYIKENKHLPEVPSAKEMEENGIKLGEMNMLLLKKVEELTLYVIELERKVKQLEARQ